MLKFSDCTLKKLDKTFGLKPKKDLLVLQNWLAGEANISDLEKQILLIFQNNLIANVYDWNETELIECFIGPIFTLVNFTSDKVNFFAERSFKGVVDGIELGGEPDGMVASGFREPEKPYFCFQEYTPLLVPPESGGTEGGDGDPAGQCLAAMLVAQELNEAAHPIYGCYVLGREWSFMILQGREYVISNAYLATRDDIFDIFRILKVLKQIVIELVAKEG